MVWLVVGLFGLVGCWFVLFVCLVGWLVCLLVGCLLVVGLVFWFGWLVNWLVGCWFDCLLFWLVGLFVRLVGWLVGFSESQEAIDDFINKQKSENKKGRSLLISTLYSVLLKLMA